MDLSNIGKKGLWGSNKEQDVAKQLAIVVEDLSQIENMGNVAKELGENFSKLGDAQDKIRKAANTRDYDKAAKSVEKGVGDVLDVGLNIIAVKGDIIQNLNVFLEFGPTLKEALEVLLDDVNSLVKVLQNEEVQVSLAEALSDDSVTLNDVDKASTFSNRDTVRDVVERMNRIQHNLEHLEHALNALGVFGRSLRRMQLNKNTK